MDTSSDIMGASDNYVLDPYQVPPDVKPVQKIMTFCFQQDQ